jgi:hypothetical protein
VEGEEPMTVDARQILEESRRKLEQLRSFL